RPHAGRLRLVGDDEEVADDVERVGAHLVVRQLRLRDHGGLARVGDVHRRHILGRRFVGDPEHATAIPRELDGHALTAVAEAVGGRYTLDLAKLGTIDAGPGYSTAHGPVIEGERIQIGLMRVPRGTGGRPHSHPNEQWIYVIQGTLESEVDGVKSRVPAGSLIYIPANVVHSALATPDAAGV